MKLVNIDKSSQSFENVLVEEETFGIKDKKKRVQTYSLNSKSEDLKESLNNPKDYEGMMFV